MKLLYIITIIASLLSCTKKEADINFSIRVKNNKNISVANADVFINNKLIGKTSKDGKINYKSSYIKNSRLQIEITKKSDKEYFSPYFEKVSLSDNNDQSQSITAVLYSVPKPKKPTTTIKSDLQTTVNSENKNVESTNKTIETQTQNTNLEEKYKKEDNKENNPHIVSISTTFKKSPVSDVEVYLQTNAKYIFVCRTNREGKCLSPLPKFENYTIIAKKPGYTNYSLRITDNTKTRFKINLEKGNDITIQTLLSENGSKTRLKNSKIYLNKKLEGKTDKQGIFIKNISYELGEIIDLKIVPSESHLKPFTTSIVYSSAINIKKTFFKATTPKIEINLLQASITGKNSNLNIDKEYKKIVKSLQTITKDKEYISTTIVEKLKPSQIKKGFNLKPTIFSNRNIDIQFELYNQNQQIIYSTRTSANSRSGSRDALKELILRAANHTKIYTTVSKISGNRIYFDDRWNNKKTYNNRTYSIVSFTEKSKGKYEDTVVYESKIDTNKSNYVTVPATSVRKRIKIGDSISFKVNRTINQKLSNFILVKNSSRKVYGANIYLNKKWIGQTDENGIVYLESENIGKKGLLKVIKAGFNDYTKPVTIRKNKNLTVKLKKALSQIFVETIPSKSKVYIDSKYIGRTPLSKPLKANSGFIKLEIIGPNGYKKHSQVVDLTEDELNLTGDQSIQLYKDRMLEANRAFRNKNYNRYLTILGSISKIHPDYLEAQHLMGEMLLFKLDRSKDALIAFNEVTSNKEVNDFINKKYIKTHILEGVAYYNIFSSQKKINEYSTKLLQKSIDKLNEVKPYLRYLSSGEYPYLNDTVYYYKALSFQKLYKISNDKRFIEFALKSWDDYFSNTNKATSSYFQKATIYNKQMLAIMKTKGNRKI